MWVKLNIKSNSHYLLHVILVLYHMDKRLAWQHIVIQSVIKLIKTNHNLLGHVILCFEMPRHTFVLSFDWFAGLFTHFFCQCGWPDWLTYRSLVLRHSVKFKCYTVCVHVTALSFDWFSGLLSKVSFVIGQSNYQ